MSPIAISVIVLACVFGGALLGALLRVMLPEHHLSAESKDVVKLAMGLIATMSALVLGLLIASAKSSFDAQSSELKQVATSILLLDRAMAHYGPEAKDARDLLSRRGQRDRSDVAQDEFAACAVGADARSRRSL